MTIRIDESPEILAPPRLAGEWRLGREIGALHRSAVWRGEGIADGDGMPVLLIPGFLAGDATLRTMADWLRRTGHRPVRAEIRLNVGCSGAVTERLETILHAAHAEHEQRVAIVGQSRGGQLARVLAVRAPELVSGIVTLGSPLVRPLAVHPVVRGQLRGVALLDRLGMPGLLGYGCERGDCCADFWAQLAGPFPEGVGFVSVFSRSDGLVDWTSCLDPAAQRYVEIDSTHNGMGFHPGAYRALVDALSELSQENRTGPRSAPLNRTTAR